MRGPTWSAVARGVAAGAAGTAALNAITYLDMALRGRPPSPTPRQTVEKLAGGLGVSIPGGGDEHDNRAEGLGSLMGLLAGVGSGLVLGIIGERVGAGGRRLSFGPSAVAAAVVAMVAGNGPMTALGVTHPREWPLSSWAADVIPHLGYGLAAAWVLTAEPGRGQGPGLAHPPHAGEPRPGVRFLSGRRRPGPVPGWPRSGFPGR